ncbi:hypothetical protein NKH47_22820 [Mesorhizobium sp. M1060]|uniref:hypothetical protein n=1 Tax=unclassified Mesorhizobium TaxID=325217 RepID=UPI00041A8BEC|nr:MULTISPECIES: hypothetical protein [unclassified Mesorhizobium]WJI50609.1 hypothetical protein NLY44_29655 [Mesorhizobium sp. C089B]
MGLTVIVAGNRHAGEAAGRGLMTDMGIVRATRHKRRLAGRALARPALRGIRFLH